MQGCKTFLFLKNHEQQKNIFIKWSIQKPLCGGLEDSMKTLRLGSEGPQVEMLQLALTRAGFPPAGGIDGDFGSGTYNALRSFQTRNSLASDGIAGQRTWSRLTPWLTGYITRTVVPGDTFYGLAARYNTTIRAIAAANPSADPGNLRPGTRLIIPLAFPVVPTNISYTSTLMDFLIRGLRARYPFIKTGSIGNSVLGKPIYNIDIGTGENQVFYNGAHHSDEWITSVLLMKFLENYALALSLGGTIFEYEASRLYNGTVLSIVPMVNPDGSGFHLHKKLRSRYVMRLL
jgi:g-D-glutamyl-meso-diaminopimelate peptidase